MNTAFLDAQNLAWKIHHVESGFADRSILKSYESERRFVANNLLDFDAKYAKLFSQNKPSSDVVSTANAAGHTQTEGGQKDAEENEFVKTFKESCEFTSGYGVAYQHNALNWSPKHSARSPAFIDTGKGTTLRTGRILTATTVTRAVDANVVHLEQEIPLNGSFRMYLFCGTPTAQRKRALADFAHGSLAQGSYFSSFLRPDRANVSYHDHHNPHSRFFTFCSIVNAKRTDLDIDSFMPEMLARYRDHVYADDVWDQRVPDAKAAAHAKMGFSEQDGGLVVVRPDGYVGCIINLTDGKEAVKALNQYFGSFTAKKLGERATDVQAQL